MLKQSLYYPRQCLKCEKKLNDILENLPTNEDEVYGIELAENGNDCFNAYSRHMKHYATPTPTYVFHFTLFYEPLVPSN